MLLLFEGRTSCAPLNHGACGSAYQRMPVKVRIAVHEELLCGSSHVEDPHHTASPGGKRRQRRMALRVRFRRRRACRRYT